MRLVHQRRHVHQIVVAETLAVVPAPRGTAKSKEDSNDSKNWFMETPGPVKDSDVNKLFGIRNEAEEIEKGPRRR